MNIKLEEDYMTKENEYKAEKTIPGQLTILYNFPDLKNNINTKDNEGKTLLHYALAPRVIEYLATRGADIDAKDNKGKTTLHYAAEMGDTEVVKALLQPPMNEVEPLELAYYNYDDPPEEEISQPQPEPKYKEADINLADNEGKTALHYAAEQGKQNVAECLISAGADINAEDKEGKTAINYAIEKDQPKLVKYLLEEGAAVDSKALLDYSLTKDDSYMMEYVLKRVGPNQKDNNGKTALHYAVEQDKKNIARYLTSEGANIDAKDKKGNTALHYAVKNNNQDMVKLLVSKCASVNIRNNKLKAPKHLTNDQSVIDQLNSEDAKKRTWKEYFSIKAQKAKEAIHSRKSVLEYMKSSVQYAKSSLKSVLPRRNNRGKSVDNGRDQ